MDFLEHVESTLEAEGLSDYLKGNLYQHLKANYLKYSGWPRTYHRDNMIHYVSGWIWCQVRDTAVIAARKEGKSERQATRDAERLADAHSKSFEALALTL